jgi:hypothetical protein
LFTGLTVLTGASRATDPAYVETKPVVDLAFFALGVCRSPAGSPASSPADLRSLGSSRPSWL